MTEALVSPTILRWARERAFMPIALLADKLHTKEDTVVSWETGTTRPTFKQAEKFAATVHIPFGYLFLSEPPQDTLPIPDLRTQADTQQDRFSVDFFDLLQDVIFKKDWFRDYLLDHGAKDLPFVGKFAIGSSVKNVAADIRSVLGINFGGGGPRSWEGRLNALFEKCEDIGIWVMRTGYVGSSTHRTLNVSEFRGFAIADTITPLIFINGRDAKPAQAFTLAHELAHIWLGQSGISDPYLNRRLEDEAGIERTCNAIAAEILVPHTEFMAQWDDGNGLVNNAHKLSLYFRVSRVVIARRAMDFGKISWGQYNAFFEQEQKSWPKPGETSGGNFFAIAPVKNGKRFTRAVVNSAMSGNLLLRDAGALLHMKPATVRKLYARQTGEI
jgi:Zn-dependent peptidase ImmA (M78 family)